MNQLNPIILFGIGEMAGVFGRGLLRSGYPLHPVVRNSDIQTMVEQIPDPAMTLLSVGEKDLHPALKSLPAQWRNNLVLLQNELLPRDWQAHNITDPTVVVVWFEKKKGQDYKVLVPSPVFGPNAAIIVNALEALDIPTVVLSNNNELLFELVRKNVYILTTNISGLVVGGTVETLWNEHKSLALEVANEIIDIQDYLTQQKNDREKLIGGMVSAIEGDLQHKCMGRSAPSRLANALQYADQANLKVPKLREIYKETVISD